jgi:hypothetical protein
MYLIASTKAASSGMQSYEEAPDVGKATKRAGHLAAALRVAKALIIRWIAAVLIDIYKLN